MSQESAIQIERDQGNFHYDTDYEFDAGIGLNEETIRYISKVKEEDEWVYQFRLKALKSFNKKADPTALGLG